MGNLLKRRVEERIAALGTNAFEVARQADLERNFVNDILNEKKATVRGPNLLKLAKGLHCSADYLIREDAPPPASGRPEVAIGAEPPHDLSADMVAVPEYDVRLSMGPGALVGDETAIDVWQISRRYLQHTLGVRTDQLAVVEVIGDSMEPTLHSGDRVLIDHQDRNPGRGGLFAVWDGDATVVKRLERVPHSNPRQVVLISDNPRHNQYRVSEEDLHVIGRVVWVARRL